VNSCQLPSKGGVVKGFGFANFETHEMARLAIEGLNGRRIDSKTLVACRAQARDERERQLKGTRDKARAERQQKMHGLNLYVKNLHSDIDDDRLKNLFSPHGEIISCRVMMDAQGSKGFGFVCYDNEESVAAALENMNGKLVEKKPLYVSLAQSKEDRYMQLEAEFSARGNAFGRVHSMPTSFGQAPSYGQTGLPEEIPWGSQSPDGGGAPAVSNKFQWHPTAKQGRVHLNITRRDLEGLSQPQQTQLFGGTLFPQVQNLQPQLASKITGMLLELPKERLLHLANNPSDLVAKVDEAVIVLAQHQHQGSPPGQQSFLGAQISSSN
jgi:polyadenylate-binding protein